MGVKRARQSLHTTPPNSPPLRRKTTRITTRRPPIVSVASSGPSPRHSPSSPLSQLSSNATSDYERNSANSGADPDDVVPVKSTPASRNPDEYPGIHNSDYLPLPWTGRLGYACLNTYLRTSTPPVFSSRTCRIQSILDHRHPLQNPGLPENPISNRPDKSQPADPALGQKWVESLGLANARDIVKMARWNHRYGIRFMRLSSEMFPFASHIEYGYKLTPFAKDVLQDAGRVVAQLGHRVSVHPGQFTQLASPRKEVVDNSIRDLEFHDEMLSLLNLPAQQDRDAVMILHMGGTFGSKEETLDRFRLNYAKLSTSIKQRLVLENDDMCWSVHDLLPICQELNIPMVLDFHHNNIIFNADKIRPGTKDIMEYLPAIKETWTKKGITQKMHYSEPVVGAVTPMQRRKHSPRVLSLPPCSPDMDLMIEAKDKEQAVFELMKIYKLPGYELINNVIPHERQDEIPMVRKKKQKKSNTKDESEPEPEPQPILDISEVGMGGPERRVYWPPGHEHWLKPPKRVVAKKAAEDDTDAAAEDPSPARKAPKPKRVKVSSAEEIKAVALAPKKPQAPPKSVKVHKVDASTVKQKPAAKSKRRAAAPEKEQDTCIESTRRVSRRLKAVK